MVASTCNVALESEQPQGNMHDGSTSDQTNKVKHIHLN